MARKTDQLLGVIDQAKVTSEFELAIEEITRSGYTILKGVLSDSDLEFLTSGDLERIYEAQCKEIGGPHPQTGLSADVASVNPPLTWPLNHCLKISWLTG